MIQRGTDRMKIDHPIRINSQRASEPPGGRWAALDAEHQGRVRLVTAPADANRQAQVVFSEIDRIRSGDADVQLGDIAVLARTHRSLEPLRALCEVECLRYEVLSRDGAGAQLPLLQSREGWRTADLLRSRRSTLVSITAIRRWIDRQAKREPRNVYWQDIGAAVDEFADSAATPRLPAAEVLDALYEAANDSRRSGHASALKLMTAHGAKGLEYRHVIVMDCADWRWSGEDERRLLYVAMTRAKETLTLMRAEGGRNPYFVDLGTVEGVIDTLPRQRPEHRQDINLRYVTLGPADVDIGFAGRHGKADPMHGHIARLAPGDSILLDGRFVRSTEGHTVGRLAAKTDLKPGTIVSGSVFGVLTRTFEQTQAEYRSGVKVDRWETTLVELVLQGS